MRTFIVFAIALTLRAQDITPGSTPGAPGFGSWLSPGFLFAINSAATIGPDGRVNAVQGSPSNCVLVNGTSAPCAQGDSNGNATSWGGVTVSGTPSTGYFPTATGPTTATWQPAPEGGAGALSVYNGGTLVGTRGATNMLSGAGFSWSITDTGSAINLQLMADTTYLASVHSIQAGSQIFVASPDPVQTHETGTLFTGCTANVLIALTTGMVVNWVPDINGTGGATTFALCQLPTSAGVAVKEADGATNPTSTDVVAGRMYAIWFDGTVWRLPPAGGGGSMVYPGAGVPNSTGSAWGTSYGVGTSANQLVQLTAAAKLPAVDGSLLTNLPSPAYLYYDSQTSAIAMNGSNVAVYSTGANVPSLAAGHCFQITTGLLLGADSTTVYLYVDSTQVAQLWTAGTNAYIYALLKYCNNSGSQTVQALNIENEYYIAGTSLPVTGVPTYPGFTFTTPTAPAGVTWSTSSHTITIYANAAGGNTTGAFFQVVQQ